MAKSNLGTTVAYGDESVRMAGDPPFYMLGALGDYFTPTGEWRYWEAEREAIAGSVERIDVGL